ncbi:unnamed protein product [Schistocephalus solidus]|uniref:Uncharacterized protein n=1 Tax=Schistocephalus solidus TaxID=70667 RepID=A0A183SHQ0_SCHSO|nr:unnamed protein product [Schistocephalus solidus]
MVGRQSQAPLFNISNVQALPTCPQFKLTFRTRIGRVGYLRMQFDNNPTKLISASANSSSASPASNPTMTTTDDHSVAATFDDLPPATFSTIALSTIDGDSDFSLQAHIHLTHQPDRPLANPSNRGWETRACRTNTQQRLPPLTPSLPPRIHSPHGTFRSHAHLRKRNPPRCEQC